MSATHVDPNINGYTTGARGPKAPHPHPGLTRSHPPSPARDNIDYVYISATLSYIEGHIVYKKMDTLTNGLSQADFTLLRVLYNGGMTDILSLIGTLGGGPITATQLPLSISGAVLSIDLSS